MSPRRRRPDEYLFVSQNMHRDPKVAGLATDSARWAWLVSLAEAKKLRTGGRFANEGQYAMCVGAYAAHLDDLLEVGLLARDGAAVVVVNYEDWQDDGPVYIDATKAERDRRYREQHRAEIAARMAARRQNEAESSGDATDDATPPPQSPPPPEPPPPLTPPTRSVATATAANAAGAREEPIRARHKRIIEAALANPNLVAGVVDAYRAIFGEDAEPPRLGPRLADLVKRHPYGAKGVVTDLARAATRDVVAPLDYVAQVMHNANARQDPKPKRGKGEQQDSDQYADVGEKAGS